MYKIVVFGLIVALILTGLPALSNSAAAIAPPAPSNQTFTGHPSCGGLSLENPTSPECEAFIASRPAPNVSQIPVDFGVVSNEVFIRFNRNEVPIYDSPGGEQIDTLITGYTYVTPVAFEDGYAKLSRGRWVSMEDARRTTPSTFAGVTIGNLDMPFAWILWRHYPTNAPAGARNYDEARLERYQVVNIYATVNVRGWDWHLIGPGIWTNQQNLSIVYPGAPAEFGGRWVGVNLYEQNLVAYENNRPVFAGLVSSGLKNGKWDTHEGTFSIGVRVENGKMSGAEGREDFYSLESVPYAQYFDGLISLHGTYWHDSFGYPQSHGCVNLSISDSKWLFEWLGEGSTVYVY
jgi:hypothetical protein